MSNIPSHVNKLLRMLLLYTDFDRARLYIMSPLRDIALLVYAINKTSVSSSIDDWPALNKIDFDYHKFFCKKTEDYNANNYKDIICRFWNKNSFHVQLNELTNISNEILENHKRNNVRSIAMTKLVINKEEYFGHIALDRSMRNNFSIIDSDITMLDEVMELISESLIKAIQDDMLDAQYRRFLQLTNILLLKIQARVPEKDLLQFMLKEIVEICPSIDLLQIKEVDLTTNKYKYLALEANDKSLINSSERILLYSLINKEFLLEENQKITSEVVSTQKSVYVKNMYYAPKKFTGWFRERRDKDEVNNPQYFISRRNNSEINIPLKYGNVCYGVIDAHGRRPYSIDTNTVKILSIAAPWVSIIWKSRQLHGLINIDKLKKNIDWQNDKFSGTSKNNMFNDPDFNKMQKEGIIDVIVDKNDLMSILSDIMYGSEYEKMAKIYIDDIRNIMWFKFSKYSFYGILSLCIVSLFLFLTGHNLFNPVFAFIGAVSSPVFILMSEKAENHYNRALKKKKEYVIAEYLKNLTILK